MSLTLWLIRHGQTTINAGEWNPHPTKACLTDLGKTQALKAANQVEKSPDRIIQSPLIRAQQSAAFLTERWPESPVTIWPIQEFIYLSPSALNNMDPSHRRELVLAYWDKSDPFYRDGNDTESFHDFLNRVQSFHTEISRLNGFVVVVGHGQFFKAYQLGLQYGFNVNETWMRRYRQEEVNNPIKNGEIVQILIE